MNNNTTKTSDETYNGLLFFRKLGAPYISKAHIYSNNVERTIIKILMEHSHPNIVNYYELSDDYITMEQVNSEKSNPLYKPMTNEEIIEIQQTMSKVKDFLQSLGIIYVDWKYDNLGKSLNGAYKLFDFDASGLIDLTSKEWILKPQHYWSYNEAIKNGALTPKEIDDWSFNYNMITEVNKTLP
jgi:serine/threonine protein kinase